MYICYIYIIQSIVFLNLNNFFVFKYIYIYFHNIKNFLKIYIRRVYKKILYIYNHFYNINIKSNQKN